MKIGSSGDIYNTAILSIKAYFIAFNEDVFPLN
jgi:hypothetical protein